MDDDGEFDERLRHITQTPIARNKPGGQEREQQPPRDDAPVEIKTYEKKLKMDVDYKAAMKKMKIIPTLCIDYPTLEILGIA